MQLTATPTSGTTDHDDGKDGDGYRGPATVTVDGVDHAVDLHVLGHFEPVDGRYHWYGRIAVHDGLDAALAGRTATVRVTTPVGSAEGELSDVDPWGRYRLAGTSTPPYPVGPYPVAAP